jgi:hypothetical protein
MLSIFMESLPYGWPAMAACAGGLVVGLRFQIKQMAVMGGAVVLLSLVFAVASLFLRAPLIEAVWGTCQTDGARALIATHGIVNLVVAWIGAFGAGLLSAKLWKVSRIGGSLLAITAGLAGVPYAYLSLFAATYYPGCFI